MLLAFAPMRTTPPLEENDVMYIRARSSRALPLRRCNDHLRMAPRIAFSAVGPAAALNETPMPPLFLLTGLDLNVSPRKLNLKTG